MPIPMLSVNTWPNEVKLLEPIPTFQGPKAFPIVLRQAAHAEVFAYLTVPQLEGLIAQAQAALQDLQA